MTVMCGDSPRVRLECAATVDGLATVLEVAVGILADARRIQPAGPGEPADVLHTVGEVAAGRFTGAARRVHTVDRVALRRGGLTATTGWAHRQRRFAGAVVTWLVHGSTAGQVLVASGVVQGDRVHGLPLVAPRRGGSAGGQDRSAVRDRLGIAPGVGLVVGCEPGPGQSVPGWADAIGELRRTDVAVIRYEADRHGRAGALSFDELLLAADLFVAAGLGLTACNPAAAAVAAGVPVIATTTDSAAELVRFGRTGFVVPPHPAPIAAAVRAGLDGALPRGGRRPPRPRDDAELHSLARGLLGAYHRALRSPRAPTVRGVP